MEGVGTNGNDDGLNVSDCIEENDTVSLERSSERGTDDRTERVGSYTTKGEKRKNQPRVGGVRDPSSR